MRSPCVPATVLALALLAGCVVPSYRRAGPLGAEAGAALVTIEVTNDRLSDARVNLLHSCGRRPLGTVRAQQTSRFVLPARTICGFETQLALVPTDGSAAYTTEEFVASPGRVLAFKLKESGAFRFPDRD